MRDSGKSAAFFSGKSERWEIESIFLQLQAPLKPGDGIVFDAGHPDEEEEGGRVTRLRADSSRKDGTEIQLFGEVNFSRIHPGDKVWKTSDPELDRELRQSFSGTAPHFQRPIDLEVQGGPAAPVDGHRARRERARSVEVDSAMPLAAAQKQPLTEERLREQLGRLGGTGFRLRRLANKLEGDVILPVSELNRLRRELVSQLEDLRARPPRWILREARPKMVFAHGSAVGEPRLAVLVRAMPQLEAALALNSPVIYCEFEDPKNIARRSPAHAPRRTRQSEIFVAPPRIFKTGEEWIQKQVRSCEADGWLVRNYDHLRFFADGRRVGDFSLNVANALDGRLFQEPLRPGAADGFL